jgi:vacuolar-type H+-ATPase subunit E/Vma4
MSVKAEMDFSQAVLEEAQDEAAKIVDLAKREAERILDGARAELDQIYRAEAPQTKKQEASIRYTQIIAAAQLENRRQLLLARERFIQSVEDRVQTQLVQFRATPEYPQLLRALVEQGLTELEGEAFEVIVAPEDRALLSDDALTELAQTSGKRVTLSVQPQPGITGAIIQRTDQRVRCNNSLQAILEREQIEIRRLILQELMGNLEA